MMHQIEEFLDQTFTRYIRYRLSDHLRSVVVRWLPWVALGGGISLLILSCLSAYAIVYIRQIDAYMYRVYHYANGLPTQAGPLTWLSVLLLVLEAILLFVSFGWLLSRQRLGWLVVFWTTLVSLLCSLLRLVVEFDLGGFVLSLAGSGICLYLLFQIRGYYTSLAPPAKIKTTKRHRP